MVDQVLNFIIMHMKCDNLNFLLLSINLSYSLGWLILYTSRVLL